MLAIIIIWSLTFITFALGYILGLKQAGGITYQGLKEEAKKRLRKITNPLPVGPIYRPTERDLLKRQDPHTRLIEEGKAELKQLLDKHFKKDKPSSNTEVPQPIE